MAKKEKGFAAEDMLTSKNEIMDAFNFSEHMFWEYIEQGMPALYLKGRWSASVQDIRDWWKDTRRVQMRNMMKQIQAEESTQSMRQ
jgi:hypothetical protein